LANQQAPAVVTSGDTSSGKFQITLAREILSVFLVDFLWQKLFNI